MNFDHLIKRPSSLEGLVKCLYLRVQDLDRLSDPHFFESKGAYMCRQEIQQRACEKDIVS